MDYVFTFDEYQQPLALFSMDHEAIGRWFGDELGSDAQKIQHLLSIIEQLESRQIVRERVIGRWFELHLDQDDVEVQPRTTDVDDDEELPEDMQVYQCESAAMCGLEDFKQALISWQQFIQRS